MSQEQAVVNSVIGTYGRLLPLLRRALGPAGMVLLTTVSGGVLMGPAGFVPGAFTGTTLAVYSQEIIAFFRVAATFVMDHPFLVAAITRVIEMIRNYVQNQNEANQIMDG